MFAEPTVETIAQLRKDPRSQALLREHFDLERALSNRLRHASPDERLAIYGSVYAELFDRVVDHPQTHVDHTERAAQTADQIATVRNMFPRIGDFLEIGTGDAQLACAIAAAASSVVALDVTDALFPTALPANVRTLLSDGVRIDLPDESIDLAYSFQVLEHLHPDDARGHLNEVLRVLRPGGRYYCVTPNRYSGPHDISVYFASTPMGFHLREYSYGELADEMRAAGFRITQPMLVRQTRSVRIPLGTARIIEASVARVETVTGNGIRFSPKLRAALGIHMIGIK